MGVCGLEIMYPLLARHGADFDVDIIDGKVVTGEKGLRYCKEEKEMGYRKTITLIGSMSEVNKAAMMDMHSRLTLRGAVVHLPYMDRVPENVSDEQIQTLHSLHEYKMHESDLVIVVDVDGHIGKDTQREINWCLDNYKTIIYVSDIEPNSWLEPNCNANIRPSDKRNKQK